MLDVNVKKISQSKVVLLSYYGSFVYELLWRNKNIQIREVQRQNDSVFFYRNSAVCFANGSILLNDIS